MAAAVAGRGDGRAEGRCGRAEPPDAPPRRAPSGPTTSIEDDEDDELAPRRVGPRATPFGSVWDSQLGTPTRARRGRRAPLADDEDFDEPEIPEYLIAEQRRGAAGPWRRAVAAAAAPRGGRSAYQSAMERERYGRGGGGGGINRYPDVSGRTAVGDAAARGPGLRPRRSTGRAGRVRRAGSSSEPWSDVPPELEAMLRAQVAPEAALAEPARAASRRGRRRAVAATGIASADARGRDRAEPRRSAGRPRKAAAADELDRPTATARGLAGDAEAAAPTRPDGRAAGGGTAARPTSADADGGRDRRARPPRPRAPPRPAGGRRGRRDRGAAAPTRRDGRAEAPHDRARRPPSRPA